MKSIKLKLLVASVALASTMAVSAAKTVESTRVGDLEFNSGYPTEATMEKMINEMDFQRATQAYLWAIPLQGVVNWLNVTRNEFNLEEGQLAYYFTPKQKAGIITSNMTTPYVVGMANLSKTGPLVLDIPEMKGAGMLLDVHQRVLSDVSLLGPDKGKGGKYLLVPPGMEDVNPEGYHVVHSSSNIFLFGLRFLDKDIERVTRESLPKISSYTYNGGKLGKKMPVAPALENGWSHIPKEGLEYWKTVHQWLQEEGEIEERDRFITAYLKGLGIEKGKPFNPTAEQKKILIEASTVGRAMAQSNDYTKRFQEAWWPGTNWKDAVTVDMDQNGEHHEQIDERAAWFWEAITVSRGMKSTVPGFGQRYLVTYQDSDGAYLSGEHTYKLNVPANVPATNFWSTTVYDEETRTMIQNDVGSPDVSSRKQNLRVNDDGSVDVYFGPKPVKGYENNWVQTKPGEGWFPYFRFYGPTEAMFDKSWSMGDIELVK